MTKSKAQLQKEIQEKEKAIKSLKKILKPGDTIFTKLNYCSSNGMTRAISLIVMRNNEPLDISYDAAIAMGDKLHKTHDGITIGGCGMDMGFALVYNLSSTLYRNGFNCIGEKKCPSNDHVNGDRNYNKHKHNSSGYALRQRWL